MPQPTTPAQRDRINEIRRLSAEIRGIRRRLLQDNGPVRNRVAQMLLADKLAMRKALRKNLERQAEMEADLRAIFEPLMKDDDA